MFTHEFGQLPVRLAVDIAHKFIQAQELERRMKSLPSYVVTEVNCHVTARVIAPLIRSRVSSGSFRTMMRSTEQSGALAWCDNEHSWISLLSGWILDPRPIGIMSDGPILVSTKSEYPGFWHYASKPIREAPRAAQSRKMWRMVHSLRKELANSMLDNPLTEEDFIKRFSTLIGE